MYSFLNEDDSDDEETFNKFLEFSESLEKATMFHSNKIMSEDVDMVTTFIEGMTKLMLEKTDGIEDNELALELTQLIAACIGGMGHAIIQLKTENDTLKEDVINQIAPDQNPELN
jgi:hypothetical protein